MTPQASLPNPLEHMRRRIGALPSPTGPTNPTPEGRNGPAPALPSFGSYSANKGPAQSPSGAMSKALPNPYTQAESRSRNPLLSAAMSGFMRGYDPAQWQSDQDRQKSEGVEKGKKLLALAQQQRSLPVEQRAQWWQANAPMIGQLAGVDTTQPVDPSQFSDQALDGHIAALTGQLGIVSEPMSEYQKAQLAQKEAEMGKPTYMNTRAGVVAIGPEGADLAYELPPEEPEGISPYQQAQLELAREKFEFDKTKPQGGGSMTPYQQFQAQRAQTQDAQKQKERDQARRVNINKLGQGIELVDQFISHDGFNGLYGLMGPTPKIPGTKEADAEAILSQIGGQAFLAGVENMRGTGPLSDREGASVVQAITRLTNRNQSPEAARQAAAEFQGSMRRLIDAYQQEAGGAPALTPDQRLQSTVRNMLPSSVRGQIDQPQRAEAPRSMDIDPEVEAILNEAFGSDEQDDLSDAELEELRQLEVEFGAR